MPRLKLIRAGKSDLFAEVRAALGHEPENLESDLAKLLLSTAKISPGVIRAVAHALLHKDELYSLNLKRLDAGRPAAKAKGTPVPLEVKRFIDEKMKEGQLRKNVLADAQSEFGVGRSTIYRLLEEAKAAEVQRHIQIALQSTISDQPAKNVSSKRKKAKRASDRKKTKILVGRYRFVRADRHELRTSFRFKRASQKREDNWD
ncbi:hypothetical protein [Sphingomonas sp. RB1R13]|uniref:hypothetical protein n=1 Tax=Sphingomonas sp. RB1R13 TaxID=3096159 RepID=UPI002FCBBA75